MILLLVVLSGIFTIFGKLFGTGLFHVYALIDGEAFEKAPYVDKTPIHLREKERLKRAREYGRDMGWYLGLFTIFVLFIPWWMKADNKW